MKVGTAVVEITPPFPMPMGGYGNRVDPADGVHDPLFLTVLYLAHETEVWLVSADLVQFPDGAALKAGLAEIAGELGCPESAILLHATHTHGGPQTVADYGVDSPQKRVQRSVANQGLIRNYQAHLWTRTVEACRTARAEAVPGRLLYSEGKTSFPMNRRAWVDGEIGNAPNPEGPFDDRLRLLGAESLDGRLLAMGMILAAHPVATGAQHRWTADYVGAWRQAVRQEHRGVVPFFLQGCAGDARPAFCRDGAKWRQVGLDELPVMGRHLLAETEAVLKGGWSSLEPTALVTGRREVVLPCQPLYTREEALEPLLASADVVRREYAQECRRRLRRGEAIPDRVSLVVSRLKLAADLELIGLGCEPLYALGRQIEAAFADERLVILGYTDGCFGYLPEGGELLKGGYETETYLYEPLSGPFFPDVADRVIEAIRALRD